MNPSDDLRKTNKLQTLLSPEYSLSEGKLYKNNEHIDESKISDAECRAMIQLEPQNEYLIDNILRLDHKQGGTIHQYIDTNNHNFSNLVAARKIQLNNGVKFDTQEQLNSLAKEFGLEIKWDVREQIKNNIDLQILKQIKKIFPKFKEKSLDELTFDLVPPNGKDFYEQIKIRWIEDNDVLPNNSCVIKHYEAAPSNVFSCGYSEHMKNEFAFSVNGTSIEPYWMQDGCIYKDALNRSAGKFYATPDNIKQDLSSFLSKMVERTKHRSKGMER